MQIGGLFDYTVADYSGEAEADGVYLLTLSHGGDLLLDALADAFGRQRKQRVNRVVLLRVEVQRSDDLVALHQADRDVFHHQYADCLWHLCYLNLFKPLKAAAL